MPDDRKASNKDAQRATSVGAGYLPPTVSAPSIHYTTTVDTRAIFQRDTVVLLAYSSNYKKRVMHPLDHNGMLDIHQQRPLYLEDCPKVQGNVSIFDLLCNKFANDPPRLFLFLSEPPPTDGTETFREWNRQSNHCMEWRRLFDILGESLPFVPGCVKSFYWPDPPKDLRSGQPRFITVVGSPTDRRACQPVQVDDGYLETDPIPVRNLMDLD